MLELAFADAIHSDTSVFLFKFVSYNYNNTIIIICYQLFVARVILFSLSEQKQQIGSCVMQQVTPAVQYVYIQSSLIHIKFNRYASTS